MSTNRVEELESKVSRLEAAIDGLTEEFVDANERIRLLESNLESGTSGKDPVDATRLTGDVDGGVDQRDTEKDGGEPAQDADEDDSSENASDDIIVA